MFPFVFQHSRQIKLSETIGTHFRNESSATGIRWLPYKWCDFIIYMTSSQATEMLTPITLGRIELEKCRRCHCVVLVMTHRLICNMTYLGHLSGPTTWLDLRSGIRIDLFGSKFECFVASRREECNGVRNFCAIFFSSKMICKHADITKKQRFTFDLFWKGQNVTWSSKIGYG